jgi:Domain of unknown function (DUF4266)
MCKRLALVLLGVLLLATACTAVRPWERGELARDDMAWDPNPLEAAHDGHIYFSKEGATAGGGDAGGGGCGCN